MQLDLFAHAPRHYHEAVARLGCLDLAGCRAALAEHRRQFPHGPDPAPVIAAADWLAAMLPADASPRAWGAAVLAACRALGEGRAPGALSSPHAEVAVRARAVLARGALARGAEVGLRGAAPLAEGLPWGVLALWAGDPEGARAALSEGLERCHVEAPASWLALGDACWVLGRREEAWVAYREGCGLDPGGATGWRPAADRELAALGRRHRDDPDLGGDWWAVAAVLEGDFPPFASASPGAVAQRWRRFTRLRQGDAPAPTVFYAGLAVSARGQWLATADLADLRRTLRGLHPEAWRRHREQLDRGG